MMTDTSPFDIPPLKTKEELLDFCLLQTYALESINEQIYDFLSFSYKDGFLNPKLTNMTERHYCFVTIPLSKEEIINFKSLKQSAKSSCWKNQNQNMQHLLRKGNHHEESNILSH